MKEIEIKNIYFIPFNVGSVYGGILRCWPMHRRTYSNSA